MGRFLLLALAGCYNPTVGAGAPCTTSNECPGDLQCVGRVCGGTVDAFVPPMPDGSADAALDGATVQQVVLGDNIAELRDAEIWNDFPTTNYGSGDHFSVDLNESGLLWFDLTAIGTNKTVLSAKLVITVADAADEGGGTVLIHRLREAWIESEATWSVRATNQAWSVNGARPPSSDAAPVAMFSPAAVTTAYDVTLPTSLVQAWVADPATNYGLVFVRGTSLEHVHIRTRETATPAKLIVDVY